MPRPTEECSPEEKAAYQKAQDDMAAQQKAMLGHHPDHRKEPFWSGWGAKDWIAIVVVAVGLISGYVAMQIGQRTNTSALVAINEKLQVEPADVQRTVVEQGKTFSDQLAKLETKLETARVERDGEIEKLQEQVAAASAERARLDQKVGNLEDLMRDIRELMRQGQAPLPRRSSLDGGDTADAGQP